MKKKIRLLKHTHHTHTHTQSHFVRHFNNRPPFSRKRSMNQLKWTTIGPCVTFIKSWGTFLDRINSRYVGNLEVTRHFSREVEVYGLYRLKCAIRSLSVGIPSLVLSHDLYLCFQNTTKFVVLFCFLLKGRNESQNIPFDP